MPIEHYLSVKWFSEILFGNHLNTVSEEDVLYLAYNDEVARELEISPWINQWGKCWLILMVTPADFNITFSKVDSEMW